MAPVQTIITLARRPTSRIIPGETFKFNSSARVPTENDLKEDEILVKVDYISVDPAMRGWLNDVRSYMPPVGIGEVMRAGGLGKVIASRSSKFAPGDFVEGMVGWQEYAVIAAKGTTKLTVPPGAQLVDFLGVLGMPAQTAYWGFFDVLKPKKGETIVVSGAAGAVGMIVCQLAKIHGCRVIGVAGGKDKCEFLTKELGVDVALDYKMSNFRKDFITATPQFCDMIFENVGGEILDLFLTRLKPFARIALCGAISSYNEHKHLGLQNYLTLISMRATLRGFIVFDYAPRYAEARRYLAQWLSEGKLKRKEHRLIGIESCEEGLIGLFEGRNTGKTVIDLTVQQAKL